MAPSVELLTAWLLLLLYSGASHGYEMARRLQAHRMTIDSPYIYRTLRKLEHQGCVESDWTNSAVGPRRRLYRITVRGRRRLLESIERIAAVRDLHDAFLREQEHVIEEAARATAGSSAAAASFTCTRGSGTETTRASARSFG
ncbi:MAG TPA: PadR family transcriptional regulator [Solirubrobacteraceae bacterium]|nr:PadR family transcriptional regulator [Solirubrobacteraceae bacterium]